MALDDDHLYPEWCNVLSLVDVVVQARGQRQEPVRGDEQLGDQVSVEWK